MKTLSLILLAILVFSCAKKEQVNICPEKVYPKVEKPAPMEYQAVRMNINDKFYYCLDEENARIMSANWLQYKSYCESLEVILNGK